MDNHARSSLKWHVLGDDTIFGAPFRSSWLVAILLQNAHTLLHVQLEKVHDR